MNNKTAILLLSLFIFLSINVNAATYTVTKTADTNDGICDSDCSLREAIAAANATAANDVIVFDAGVFATPQTITLGGTELGVTNNGNLTLNGLNGLTISGNNASCVFLVSATSNATLQGLTIIGGSVSDNGNQNIGYNFTLVPNNLGYGYSISSGSLPNGLSLTNSFAPTAVVAISGTPTQGGTFNFAITATNGVISNTTNYLLFVLAPTAASSAVSGRVFTPTGRGLGNAFVVMTNQNGQSVSVRTNPFGYYRFNDVQSGGIYIFSVQSKRYQFATQVITVAEDLDGLNFYP
jgi:CSLREA domain-containing protein